MVIESNMEELKLPSTIEVQTKPLLSDPVLSPRACRVRIPSKSCSVPPQTVQPTPPTQETPTTSNCDQQEGNTSGTCDVGVQCMSITAVPTSGLDNQCRVCGSLFEDDTPERRNL